LRSRNSILGLRQGFAQNEIWVVNNIRHVFLRFKKKKKKEKKKSNRVNTRRFFFFFSACFFLCKKKTTAMDLSLQGERDLAEWMWNFFQPMISDDGSAWTFMTSAAAIIELRESEVLKKWLGLFWQHKMVNAVLTEIASVHEYMIATTPATRTFFDSKIYRPFRGDEKLSKEKLLEAARKRSSNLRKLLQEKPLPKIVFHDDGVVKRYVWEPACIEETPQEE
jgi:hypothetical protein